MIKQKIGDKEYSFEFTNRSFIKLDEKYENAADIFNGMLNGKNHLINSVKVMTVSCKERELTEDEIIDTATANQFLEISNKANDLILDYMGFRKTVNKPQDHQQSKKK